MKIVNRCTERLFETSHAVIAQDGPEDHVHVVICPDSGDVEVWDGERLNFKAYCDNVTRVSTAVGLSGFFRQPERGKQWKRLVERCKRLSHDRAFHEVYRFALDIAKKIERRNSTSAPRSIVLKTLLADTYRMRAEGVFPRRPWSPSGSARATGDALRSTDESLAFLVKAGIIVLGETPT